MTRPQLRLDRQLIKQRIRRCFPNGGQAELVKLMQRVSRSRFNRSTLHRWLRLEQPTAPSSAQYLRLASFLDADPMGLWELTPNSFKELSPDLIRFQRERAWASLMRTLVFVEDFLLPRKSWPPAEVAGQQIASLYGHPWRTRNIKHNADEDSRNFYAALTITPSDKHNDLQLWHFAFRELGSSPQESWFPYGFVRLINREVVAFHYNHEAVQAQLVPTDSRFVVRTRFGEESAEFCVASLHSFEMIGPEQENTTGLPEVIFW